MLSQIVIKIKPIQETPYELLAIMIKEAFEEKHDYLSTAAFLSQVFPEGW